MTKELPDMPEVDPDDGDIERHDAHYRLNPSGHKELVIQKKGEQDEETLNELAESLMEMAGDYEGLEDDDEFEDEPEDDYEYCDYCDSVITSYSIHYTKLYEWCNRWSVLLFELMSLPELSQIRLISC